MSYTESSDEQDMKEIKIKGRQGEISTTKDNIKVRIHIFKLSTGITIEKGETRDEVYRESAI